MKFKDFITRQRVGIFIVGLIVFVVSLVTAHETGASTLVGEVFVDLAVSSLTIIFTALIIDYLGVREESNKTKNATSLAEDEIKAMCLRVKLRMARLFGMERDGTRRHSISTRKEAADYLDKLSQEVTEYLKTHKLTSETTPLDERVLPRYLERLEIARTELEQTLVLYQYAMGYNLRERLLNLRSELQIADNILGFIDFSERLNEANVSLIRVISQSLYDEIVIVLEQESLVETGIPIGAKESKLA